MATAKKGAAKKAAKTEQEFPIKKRGFKQTAKLLDKVKVKKGRMIRVINQHPRSAADAMYVAIQVENATGKQERCLLFTEEQILVAEERAKKNKEDLTKKDWLTDLVD